jgi:hypothetical protein
MRSEHVGAVLSGGFFLRRESAFKQQEAVRELPVIGKEKQQGK